MRWQRTHTELRANVRDVALSLEARSSELRRLVVREGAWSTGHVHEFRVPR
jgi:hypothetical protein